MTEFYCNSCGQKLILPPQGNIAVCEYCGRKQKLPKRDNEAKWKLFEEADRLRFACEFDLASDKYEEIISDFPNEADAYWGLLLCRYGIEYEKDPDGHHMVPTCHRASTESILSDGDYQEALDNTDSIGREIYRREAQVLEELRIAVLQKAKEEEPYDIFICYKESDDIGQRTQDSLEAYYAWQALTNRGYRVFYSRVTLESHLGENYEPYIFHALQSARIMLLFCGRQEYINAVWVKNEWSRFLSFMKKDKSKKMIVCYFDMQPDQLPDSLLLMENQDMRKNGALQDVVAGVQKIYPKSEPAQAERVAVVDREEIEAITGDAFAYLKEKKWDDAKDALNEVLEMEPHNANAFLGLALIAKNIPTKEEYVEAYAHGKIEKDEGNIRNAEKYADEDLKEWFVGTLEAARKKVIRQQFTSRKDFEEKIVSAVTKKNSRRADEGYNALDDQIGKFAAGNNEIDFLRKKALYKNWTLPLAFAIFYIIGTLIFMLTCRDNKTSAIVFVICLIAGLILYWKVCDELDFLYDHWFFRLVLYIFVFAGIEVLIPLVCAASVLLEGSYPIALVFIPIVYIGIAIYFAAANYKKKKEGIQKAKETEEMQREAYQNIEEGIKDKAFQEVTVAYRNEFRDEDPDYIDIDRKKAAEGLYDSIRVALIGKEIKRFNDNFSMLQRLTGEN